MRSIYVKWFCLPLTCNLLLTLAAVFSLQQYTTLLEHSPLALWHLGLLLGLIMQNLIIVPMLYWFDKRQSQRKNKQRIPERVLLLFTLLGGALGAIYGQKRFRHKTQKRVFKVYNVLGVSVLLTLVYGWWHYLA